MLTINHPLLKDLERFADGAHGRVALHPFIKTQCNKTLRQPGRSIGEKTLGLLQVGADGLLQKAVGIRVLPPFPEVGRAGADSFSTLRPIRTTGPQD